MCKIGLRKVRIFLIKIICIKTARVWRFHIYILYNIVIKSLNIKRKINTRQLIFLPFFAQTSQDERL